MEPHRSQISRNIQKVAQSLFHDLSERDLFIGAIQEGQRSITAVAWIADPPSERPYSTEMKPLWLPEWIDTASDDSRPGKLAEHEDGALYCLDLSSTFACAPLAEISTLSPVIVDVCAAPGGKGIVARRYLAPTLLIGNEVIGKRTAPLISNYKRCSIDPAIVTSCDPALLGRLLTEKAQVVIVDAPCSGQSLVLKDLAAPGAFHPATISMNERRQRRIMANSAKIVERGGYMLYATCTFSREENEDNVEWFVKTFPEFSTVPVQALNAYRSSHTGLDCYRLYPQHGFGAGAFCCLLRREGEGSGAGELTEVNVTRVIRPVWRSPAISGDDSPRASSPRRAGGKYRRPQPRQRWRKDS